jgi:hypothetical protein
MKSLKALDEVAYVRYASVYRDFRETEDFARFLGDEGLSDDVLMEEAPRALLADHGNGKRSDVGSGALGLDERMKI